MGGEVFDEYVDGGFSGGSTLYGYRWLKQEYKWEIIPEEAEVVKRIYKPKW
jgi:hypothetical protein